MDPATIALISAGISAAGSAAGGFLGRSKESKFDKKKRELVDDLLASLKGGGSFNDLFKSDEAAFQKSYVDPAKQRFRDQISPQIQQQYIASGQQRGSGMEDTLARAGVDLDQLINQAYGQFQENAINRKQNTINQILGSGGGTQNQSGGNAALQGLAGYAAGGLGDDLSTYLRSSQNQYGPYENANEAGMNSLMDTYKKPRKGFENEAQYYNPYTGVMG